MAIQETLGLSDIISVRPEKSVGSKVFLSGKLSVWMWNSTGGLAEFRQVVNTVTTGGKQGAADQILAAPALNKPTHMAVGTGAPAANALGAEIDRNALATKTRSGTVVTMTATWAAGDGTGALTEAGIFDAAAVGNMWTSAAFAVVNKTAADTLAISWDLTVA